MVIHCPPPRRTARSRTVGWPSSIANRARNSVPFWPSQDTPSRSCVTAAVIPGAALYPVTSQLSARGAGAAASRTPCGRVDTDLRRISDAIASERQAAERARGFVMLPALRPDSISQMHPDLNWVLGERQPRLLVHRAGGVGRFVHQRDPQNGVHLLDVVHDETSAQVFGEIFFDVLLVLLGQDHFIDAVAPGGEHLFLDAADG